ASLPSSMVETRSKNVRHCCLSSLRVVMEISHLGQGCRNGACSAGPHGERTDRITERGVARSRTFYVSKSSKVLGLRRGEQMRVRSVELGGSLAGKLSSKLSSILSSVVAAAGGSGWCLRRASTDPRRCCRMDRGITSPAASRHSHKYSRSTRPTCRARAHDT